MSPDSADPRPAGRATSSSVNEMDATGANLLSEAVRIFFLCQVCILNLHIASYICFLKPLAVMLCQEKRLCCELGLPPTVYLKMQEDLSVQMIAGNVSSKSDAHRMFQMDTVKVDMVYDMLIKKGFGSH